MSVKTGIKILKIKEVAKCSIVKRVNRFVVEIAIETKHYRASINNTGRLEQFLVGGREAYCVPQDKGRKTDYKLFAIEDGNAAAIIDTQLQMRAFEQSLEGNMIPWLDGCRFVRRNARLGRSVIDYLLDCGGENVYLEVKSAVLRDGDYAMYPDCPTDRGRRHIMELTGHVKTGGMAIILFIAALEGVNAFKPDVASDPELYELLVKSVQAGVQARAINIAYSPEDSFIYLYEPDMTVLI
jgi:sugar fermentation stimulation protein A